MTGIAPDTQLRIDFSAPMTRRDGRGMQVVHSDTVIRVPPGTTPDYRTANPLLKLLQLVEQAQLAAERECYASEQLQYLFPYERLELYGPSGGDADLLDPTRQDNKTDFQKQNVKDFVVTDTHLVRGWATVGDWTGPFLRLSYRGGPDSHLWNVAGGRLSDHVRAWVQVGNIPGAVLTVPYNQTSGRYEIELWGYAGADLHARLDARGQAAMERGELVARPDLVHGDANAFAREAVDGKYLAEVATDHAMHPVLPLHVAVAWADDTQTNWDSQLGANYQYEFNMTLRGWDNYLGVGISANPHGGVGFLEYRNLLSNYGRYEGSGELARGLAPWSFDALGHKDGTGGPRVEPFFAVDYMDLHILRPNCGIGLHRHRDNQEVFFMMEGQGLMVVGDWCKMPARERCFEVRTLRAGHLSMLKGGNLHALMNPSDEDLSLFMFGGYD